jgi:hypothetical protein
VSDETRVVLVKPGDVLCFGNVGHMRPEALDRISAAMAPLKEDLGLREVLAFDEDIDLTVVAGGSVAAVLNEHRDEVELARRAVATGRASSAQEALVAVDETVRAAVSKEWP